MPEMSELPSHRSATTSEVERVRPALPALLWLFALPFFLVVHYVPFLKPLLIEFPSMVVHEIGHSVFAWLAGLPALSFFFISFHFTREPLFIFVLVLLGLETFLLFKLRSAQQHLIFVLVALCMTAHFFFFLFSQYSEPCAIFGGMAGEMVLPILLLVVVSELTPSHSYRLLGGVLLSSIVFWNSLYEWIFAYLGHAPIPYPHDDKGMFLLQDPFSSLKKDSAPVGDLDKLLKVFGWSEELLKAIYLCTGIISLLLFIAYVVWRANSFELHLPNKLKGHSDQNKTQSS